MKRNALLVSFVILTMLGVLSINAEPLTKIKDDNFLLEYSSTSLENFEQINPNATTRDLATFFEDIYQQKLSRKLQAGLPISKVEIQILYEVIMAEGQVVSTFGQAFMKDIMDKYPALSEKEMLAKAPKDKNGDVYEDFKIFAHLLVEFRDGRQDRQLRNLISKYASTFKPISDQAIQDDVYCVVKQVYQPFKIPAGATLGGLNPFKSIEKSIEGYEDPYLRPYKAIYPNLIDFANNAKEIGENWNVMYSVISHYIKLLRRINRELIGYNSVARDQKSRQMVEDFLINQKKDITETLKTANMIFVDLPFVFLTKYAYIHLQRCKSPLWDDDDRMLGIASVYAISVYGNAMLNDIASAHAAVLLVSETKFWQFVKSAVTLMQTHIKPRKRICQKSSTRPISRFRRLPA